MTRLMIVEDNQENLYMLSVLLKAHGYDVISAANGKEAMEKIRKNPPDVIVSDILMPEMDGFTLCRQLKTDEKYYFFSKIPVLMLTVYPDERGQANLSMHEGMTMEAEDYMHKPIDPEELLNRVETLLKKRVKK